MDVLHSTRAGQGQALVLLHYFGGSGRTWRPVMDLLANEYDCVAPDLRGWGASRGGYTSYTVDDMADDVAALLQHLGIKRYALAGHSMGGKVAMALAARQPPGLTRLLLVAPSPLTPEPMTDNNRAALRAAWGNTDQCRRILGDITTRPLPDALAQSVLADNLRAAHAAWTAWPDQGSRENLGARYAQITVPTWVLAGAEDNPLSPAYLQAHVANPITDATVQTVPNAAHLLPLEAPQAVAAFLRAHLARWHSLSLALCALGRRGRGGRQRSQRGFGFGVARTEQHGAV